MIAKSPARKSHVTKLTGLQLKLFPSWDATSARRLRFFAKQMVVKITNFSAGKIAEQRTAKDKQRSSREVHRDLAREVHRDKAWLHLRLITIAFNCVENRIVRTGCWNTSACFVAGSFSAKTLKIHWVVFSKTKRTFRTTSGLLLLMHLPLCFRCKPRDSTTCRLLHSWQQGYKQERYLPIVARRECRATNFPLVCKPPWVVLCP